MTPGACSVKCRSAATAVVSAAEQKQYNDNPAGVSVSETAATIVMVVSTEAEENDDPENAATGIISESAAKDAVTAAIFTSASTSFIASAVCCS